ncbi:MAG: PEP-CTERM sorting domain-containing protein, partial [Acidobacteria bacterium]|nr:PEP-CTERM sorting domain-containing protein [Acidobacteriota bacterium]
PPGPPPGNPPPPVDFPPPFEPPSEVPEPAAWVTLGLGLLALGNHVSRKKN